MKCLIEEKLMADEKNKKNEIDISKIDLEKMKEKTTDQPGLLPYAHTSGGAVIKPEDLGKIRGKSVLAMHQQTDNQMQQLYDQMETLVPVLHISFNICLVVSSCFVFDAAEIKWQCYILHGFIPRSYLVFLSIPTFALLEAVAALALKTR